MKFIHLTDTHVIGGGRLYGHSPVERLSAAVASINADHGDAAFVVETGDLTHLGEPEAFEIFREEVRQLTMPAHLMVGNHDTRAALKGAFPDVPLDADGFVQTSLETPLGRFVLWDTKDEGTHVGALCTARLSWLDAELARDAGPVFLFMHHPPFPIGIAGMDAISLQTPEAFWEVIAPHRNRIQHLFFGHVHRAIFGNWRRIGYSCMRGLNHQVALDPTSQAEAVARTFEPPAYGVVLLSDDTAVVHTNDFMDGSERFLL